ncbi:hypothetical protein CEXT_81661 [Caerostris extrusa]|uniref:Uncharacterized protein n=1 Tax=Caerostris extrusa TaxID=172846 RepID=A0AAV4S9H9_CAEEX|nr:hypothetical protein CEXT_81661 [Caerostris extrusa]
MLNAVSTIMYFTVPRIKTQGLESQIPWIHQGAIRVNLLLIRSAVQIPLPFENMRACSAFYREIQLWGRDQWIIAKSSSH